MQIAWEDCRWFEATPIPAKELLPIILSVVVWGTRWHSRRVLLHCDNEAVVAALRGGYSKDPDMAHLLWDIVLFGSLPRASYPGSSCARG